MRGNAMPRTAARGEGGKENVCISKPTCELTKAHGKTTVLFIALWLDWSIGCKHL
uniref:Uncharacterized protein n=1 Tax=Arundo donax TaxID=35708 RepID=A0A0A9FSD1_ARUDO